MAWLNVALVCLGFLPGGGRANRAFESGQLYFRCTDMETSGAVLGRDAATGIPFIADGCGTTPGLEREIRLWNGSLRKLWDRVFTSGTNFTVRAGDEYLIYQEFTLCYTRGPERALIHIHPEELWAVLSHCRRGASPVTGQVSMQGWYPGMGSPATAFVSAHDPAMPVIQGLLERGRTALVSQ